MLERSERILRIACLCLAALLLFQFARLVTRKDPLANLSIPELPSLAATTNAKATMNQSRAPARSDPGQPATNARPSQEPGYQITNAVSSAKPDTNSVSARTNLLVPPSPAGSPTNPIIGPSQPQSPTNAIPSPGPGPRGMPAPAMAMMGMNPMGPGGPGPKGPPLPPAIQARIDRIIDSELLAPVIRPLPMALLGIAGKDVFLRAPNGQTGLVKEGGEVGGVKLLRIGINRVLVETEGKKKELTIFAGLGGESLMPKEKETPQ